MSEDTPKYQVGRSEQLTPRTDANMRRCEAIDSHGVFPLEYVRLDFARTLEQETAKLREAMNLYREAAQQGHYSHFDPTGGAGSGCPACIAIRDLCKRAAEILGEGR